MITQKLKVGDIIKHSKEERPIYIVEIKEQNGQVYIVTERYPDEDLYEGHRSCMTESFYLNKHCFTKVN
jgi:hypothetical protein